MKLSIIIPVFNEEKNIEKIISLVSEVPINMTKEIVIIDDGSKDKTAQILKKYQTNKNIKVIIQPKNHGKGAAIRCGLKEVTGDIVLIQDADMEYSIDDYPKLLKPFESNKVNVVYGSRFKGEITGMKLPNRIANWLLTFSANVLFNTKITDEATAYKVFRGRVFKNINLKCQRFEFCPEVTAKVAKAGYEIFEVPIVYKGRSLKEGKKINWKDGFVALWILIKYRFKD